MSNEPSQPELGEERRRRVRKKRRVTTVTVNGKEVSGDFVKNPGSLEFPDPVRPFRKLLIGLIIFIVVVLSGLLFWKLGDFMPSKVSSPALEN